MSQVRQLYRHEGDTSHISRFAVLKQFSRQLNIILVKLLICVTNIERAQFLVQRELHITQLMYETRHCIFECARYIRIVEGGGHLPSVSNFTRSQA